MKSVYKVGDTIEFRRRVREEDIARFEDAVVHNVYSTFALARDAEWTCRQFVLKMREENEEGIGTYVNVTHVSPALLGSEVVFSARISELIRNEVNCIFEASVNGRIIAEGSVGQKIILKEKIERLFRELEKR